MALTNNEMSLNFNKEWDSTISAPWINAEDIAQGEMNQTLRTNVTWFFCEESKEAKFTEEERTLVTLGHRNREMESNNINWRCQLHILNESYRVFCPTWAFHLLLQKFKKKKNTNRVYFTLTGFSISCKLIFSEPIIIDYCLRPFLVIIISFPYWLCFLFFFSKDLFLKTLNHHRETYLLLFFFILFQF